MTQQYHLLFVWNREDYNCVWLYKCGYYQPDTLLVLAVQEYKKKYHLIFLSMTQLTPQQ